MKQFAFDFEAQMHAAEEEATAAKRGKTVTFEGGRITYTVDIFVRVDGSIAGKRRSFTVDGKFAPKAKAVALAKELELERKNAEVAEPDTTRVVAPTIQSEGTVKGYSVTNYVEGYEVLIFEDDAGQLWQSDKVKIPNPSFGQKKGAEWSLVPTLPRRACFIGHYSIESMAL